MEQFRPHVILSAATSIYGKIATQTGDSKFSSKQDISRLHKLRSNVDAILIGKNTVLIDDPLLTVRFTTGKDPIRIILDSKGSLSEKSKRVLIDALNPFLRLSNLTVSFNIPFMDSLRMYFPYPSCIKYSSGIEYANSNNLLSRYGLLFSIE